MKLTDNNHIRYFIHIYNSEKKYSDSSVSLKDRIWLWRRGFISGYKQILQLNDDNIYDFLDDYRYKSLHPYNGIYSRLIDSKPFLPIILPPELVCKIYVVFEKGRLIYSNSGNYKNIKLFLKNCLKNHELILKPFNKSGGFGVTRVQPHNFEDIFRSILEKKLSIQINETIQNQAYSNEVFPWSTNTIRIILMRNLKTRNMFMVSANQKFGTQKSVPVDNTSKGGIFSVIKKESGVLGKVYNMIDTNKHFSSTHPDTNVQIEGIKIPGWLRLKENIIKTFNSIEWLDYCGLDIILTSKGYKVIEINSLPACYAPQINNPYLKNPVIKDFFIAKGLKQVNDKFYSKV